MIRVGVGRHGIHRLTERWVLPDLWSLHLYSYEGELTVGDTVLAIEPGTVSVVPPATVMRFRYRGPSAHLFAHLSLPASGSLSLIPAIQRLHETEPAARAAWLAAVAAFPVSPARCRAEMWTLLWHLAVPSTTAVGAPRPTHPAVRAAVGQLELHLAEPLSVPALARSVGLSHNQLTRLFRAELDVTVVGYLRRRRARQAEHLLQHSTLAIASVAAAVGMSDLQAFNKLVHREFGCSPRALRDRRI